MNCACVIHCSNLLPAVMAMTLELLRVSCHFLRGEIGSERPFFMCKSVSPSQTDLTANTSNTAA